MAFGAVQLVTSRICVLGATQVLRMAPIKNAEGQTRRKVAWIDVTFLLGVALYQ